MSKIQKIIAFVALIGLMFIGGFYLGLARNTPEAEPVDLPVATGDAAPDMVKQLNEMVNTDTAEAATTEAVNALYSFVMATASTEGLNYQVSKSFADALNTLGYETAVVATGSSYENILALRNDKAQLAILTSDRAVQGYNGVGLYNKIGPCADLRVLMSLWPNYWQIVTLADSGIQTVHDLSGKTVAVDEVGSDADRALRGLYDANKLTFDDKLIEYPARAQAWEGLQNGTYAAVFVVAEVKSEDIMKARESETGFRLVPVDSAAYGALVNRMPYYMHGVIAADVYNLSRDIPTVMTMNVMMVDAAVPEATVYQMLSDFFADLDEMKADNEILSNYFQAANPAMDIGVPLHDGALRYFREKGMVE